MFFIKITGRKDVRNWIWTGKTWALEGHVTCGLNKAKIWKTRRGAEAFITKLKNTGMISLTENIQIVQA